MITKDQLIELEQKATLAAEKLRDARQEFANQECPFKVGDITEVAGLSHRGKKMIVEAIVSPHRSYYGSWKVRGTIINKSGDPGKIRAMFGQTEYERFTANLS